MRIIDTALVAATIKKLAIRSCCQLGDDVIAALQRAAGDEKSPLGKEILDSLLENAAIAKKEGLACCQDTGVAVVWLEIGQQVCWRGEPLAEMVNQGIREGYAAGYLRNSVVNDPLLRKNTGDNTPAVLHTSIVAGDRVTITVMPKGAGSENMSRLQMLTPADGADGIRDFVLETVRLAGGKACPPLVVGVGIGGSIDKAALLAKMSLRRSIGDRNEHEHIARLEEELLAAVNRLGIGPLGIGGAVTAMAVHILTYPCHIASLPVAVNLQCHAYRHAAEII